VSLFHLAQDDLGVPVKLGAGIRHHDALLASNEEFRSEVFLEGGELLAKCWLCDVEYIGSSCDAAGINDHNERFETPDIHSRFMLTIAADRHVTA
jgi:hypothetical protein